MYHRVFVIVLVVVVLLTSIACGKKPAGVDLARGITPVSTQFAGIRTTLEQLAALPPAQRQEVLRREYPHLETDLVYFLRRNNKLSANQRVESVEFLLGSASGIKAEDRHGVVHEGYIKDQLLAKVKVVGVNKPITVIVECLNGTFDLPGGLQSLGRYTPEEQFVIGPREGLIHHVDFRTAIDLAERFNLPLYRTQNMDSRNRITPAIARSMESNTDRIQVTVQVYEGDRFDLVNMRFTPSPHRPH